MQLTALFAVFLLFAWAIFRALPGRRARQWLLVAASLAFYAYWFPTFAILFIAMGLYSHALLRWMHAAPKARPAAALAGIVSWATLLIGYKYFYLLITTAVHTLGLTALSGMIPVTHWLVPLGLSYVTLRMIHLFVDSSRELVQPLPLRTVLLFEMFFPMVEAGPVQRIESFNDQLENLDTPDSTDLGIGMQRILFGLFKKAVVAGNLVHLYPGHDFWAYPLHYSAVDIIRAIFIFSFVIYFDFSGYTDIAIGAARLFGIRLAENFNWPYLRANIAEFWRAWHITLSDWIRDYLFVPLCGHRTTKARLQLATVSSMALCGLWHGASWNFLIWGMYHGTGLVAWKQYGQIKRKHKTLRDLAKTKPYQIACVLATFAFVSLGWVFFQVPLHTAGGIFLKIFVPWR
jgi:alginate O-acetyltransferase complex protein AlgI